MTYRFHREPWGASFQVPYSVVSKYMHSCSEQQLKTLLYILAGEQNTTSAELAQLTGLSEAEADQAVSFWVSCGVVSLTEGSDTPKTQAPVSMVEAVKPTGRSSSGNSSYRYTPTQIKEKIEHDKNIKRLFDEMQTILGVTLNNRECCDLIELYEYFKFDLPSIIMGAEYCRGCGKLTVAYLYKVMKRWHETEINTYADIEKEIIRLNETRSYTSRIKKILGIGQFSKAQEQMVEQWHIWGIAFELIEIAADKCLDKNNKIEMRYINSIIRNWHQDGIASAEQVADNDAKYRAKVEREKKSSYDIDDVEEFATSYTIKDDDT